MRGRLGSLAIVCVLAVAATACSDSSDVTINSSMRDSTPQASTVDTSNGDGNGGTIDWGTCDDPSVTDDTLQCATVTVPLDYDAANGDASNGNASNGDASNGDASSSDTIDLALVRVPATGKRLGAVLFNPGGPGGSGFDSIAQGGTVISSSLRLTGYDLVGFDPRGVDRSNGLRCLTDAEQDRDAYLDDTPDTPEEQAALDASGTAFSAACTAKYGDTLRLYSTTNTARDMDAIRIAIGDETISYLGISYGTYLGAVYATMFPDHVRAMVLDSAFEPSGDTIEQQYETQLVGFEHAFDDWATWCEANTECAFRTDDVGAAWDALRTELDATPIENADGRFANQVVLRAATIAALYSKSDWPVLGAALADASTGDPAGLFRLADGYSGRDAKGHYDTIQQSNTIINCASGIEGDTPPDPAALVAELLQAAPRFAAGIEVSDFDDSECAAMMPKQPIDTISYSGTVPIVVIGGTNDPATPFRWATEMTAALGGSATLVTYTGEGHGQLLASKCVTAIEAALLVDLTSPPADTTCDPDPEIDRPAWWDAIPQPDGIGDVFDSPQVNATLGLTSTDVYSEVHTSALSAADVLAAYQPELTGAGFTYLGEQQPLDGSEQAVYNAPNGDFFSVLALGPDAFADPQLADIADLVPEGESLVLLLYIPGE